MAIRYIFYLLLISARGRSFNVETDYFAVHRGPVRSMFGFSVAQHDDSQGTWILVGAPEAETRQPGITRGGAVYKCHSSTPDDCEPISFDDSGNFFEFGEQTNDKSNQWFGASVTSRSGVMAACAPRYLWYSYKKNRRDPIGNCFISDGVDRSFRRYSPCEARDWGYHRQGSCQAGYGLALSQDGNRLYIGAVGSWYWQGQVFYQNLLHTVDSLSTDEGPTSDDMSYLGYSMITGHFNGDEEEDIAVGMPRGNHLTGQVVLLDHRLNPLYNITGDQVGSYFGYAVAVADVNGDGFDDVLIGAPWFTNPSGSKSEFENGRVSTFLQTAQFNFHNSTNVVGRRSRSHFGLALTSLGDINHDGFDDVAVGAPHDGETGRGGVYIFMGTSHGMSSVPSQVLLAEELTKISINTFGWSLAGGLDADKNEYPDMVVGAYESDKVFSFRTRPVVKITASLRFKSSDDSAIDLDSKLCSLQDSTAVACIPLHFCLSYSGVGVPKKLEHEVSLLLDTLSSPSPRLFFLKLEGKSNYTFPVVLSKEVQKCSHLYTYVSADPRDKLTPLVAQLIYSLEAPKSFVDPRELRPILSPLVTEDIEKASIFIQNNCGRDNICVSDLKLRAAPKIHEYPLGSKKNIVLKMSVKNDGEDSYLTKLTLEVPRGARFSKFSIVESTTPDGDSPLCSALQKKQETDPEKIECEIGNPLPQSRWVTLEMDFQPNPEGINTSSLVFVVTANSTTQPATRQERLSLVIPVIVKSDVNIKGVSWPDGVFDYNASIFGAGLLGPDGSITSERQIGPEVTHVYDVVNKGPSNIPYADLVLLWPSQTLSGDPLLYLVDKPTVSPSTVSCEPLLHLNYFGLEVESGNRIVPESTISRRSRRRISEDHKPGMSPLLSSDPPKSAYEGIEDVLSCGPTNCTRMVCSIGTLASGDHVVVRIRSRLWVDTLQMIGMTQVTISSRLVIRSYALPENSPKILDSFWSGSVTTSVKTSPFVPSTSLKWLIVFGSVLAGLLVLAILSIVLWSLGFFKRKRHSGREAFEREPLRENGYFSNGKS